MLVVSKLSGKLGMRIFSGTSSLGTFNKFTVLLNSMKKKLNWPGSKGVTGNRLIGGTSLGRLTLVEFLLNFFYFDDTVSESGISA